MRVRVPVAALLMPGLVAVAVPGCGPGGDGPITVRGRVTFQGQPVAEGAVQFNDARTGRGAEAPLGADGTYTAALPAGSYVVVVIPPIIDEARGGPPDPRFKKVRNIPPRYHTAATSGLTAAVSPGTATHDFELRP